MKAILITGSIEANPPYRVQMVEIDEQDSQKSICEHLNCRLMQTVGFPDDQHSAVADEEGLNNAQSGTFLWEVDWTEEPIAGNILITGIDHAKGETTPVKLSIPEVLRKIRKISVIQDD